MMIKAVPSHANLLWATRQRCRGLSGVSQTVSPGVLRRDFLDFFAGRGHRVVPSSPVVPRNDKSLVFVNAGMNQFKSAILGASRPPAPRVANVQKCVRMGGKHNDLEAVGHDGHHHTFFEMMGNWSFGDYFKEEAVRMSWSLVTEVFGLPRDRLFVTYFGGSRELGLEADEETRELWLSLGVEEARVLPFGVQDNFWEMGAVGPCGPCTEIHFDHLGGPVGDRAKRVNAGNDDLVEVGNVVFMQYRRDSAGARLRPLDQRVVDTGFGLERLAAIKAGSTSNYDSELFRPLLSDIQRITGAPQYGGRFEGDGCQLDTHYRILADHARMITVCLSDGAFPDSNSRLKKVIKRAKAMCRETFPGTCDHHLLMELVRRTVDILGEHYVEMGEGAVQKAEIVLAHENELMLQDLELGKKALPKIDAEFPEARDLADARDADRLYRALKLLKEQHKGVMSGEAAFDIYKTCGLPSEVIEKICSRFDITFSEEAFHKSLQEAKTDSKLRTASTVLPKITRLPETDSHYVHSYSSPEPLSYQFPAIKARVTGITVGDRLVDVLEAGQEGTVYLDRTTFYAQAGGQVGDRGHLVGAGKRGERAKFRVEDCQQVLGSDRHVAHLGRLDESSSESLRVGDVVSARIEPDRRLSCMQNHTGAHLLNETLRRLMPLTCQRSSHVDETHFTFDFGAFGFPVDTNFVVDVERMIHTRIMESGKESDDVVSRQEVDFAEAASEGDLITIPGEHYPGKVSVIRLPGSGGGVEPCCGTHLRRLSDLQSFAVVDVHGLSGGAKSFHCLTGARAVAAREEGVNVINKIFKLKEELEALGADAPIKGIVDCRGRIRAWSDKLRTTLRGSIPHTVRVELGAMLEAMYDDSMSKEKAYNKNYTLSDMKLVLQDKANEERFVTHVFHAVEANVRLAKVTKCCQSKARLVLAFYEKGLFGRACVPKDLADDVFNAQSWLDKVAGPLGQKAEAPGGVDGRLAANVFVPGLSPTDGGDQDLIAAAEVFAREHVK